MMYVNQNSKMVTFPLIIIIILYKERLNCDSQQIYKYQQNEHLPLMHLKSLDTKIVRGTRRWNPGTGPDLSQLDQLLPGLKGSRSGVIYSRHWALHLLMSALVELNWLMKFQQFPLTN